MNNLRIVSTLILTLVFAFPTFGVSGNAPPSYVQNNVNCDPHPVCQIGYGQGCYYIWDDSCWEAGPGVTHVTNMLCTNPNGWDMGNGWSQTLSKTFTADSIHTTWELDFQVYFEDPNNSWYDQINAIVYVTHANGSTTINRLYSHVGNDPVGSLYCVRPYGIFYADRGDVIKVEFKVTNLFAGTIIRINNIVIWGNSF